MNRLDPQAVAARLLAVLNGGPIADLTADCDPGVVVFAPIAEEVIDPFARRDPGRLSAFVTAWRSAVPDVRFEVVRVDAGAASTTVHWSARGTHRHALGFIRPSNEEVVVTGSCVLRWSDNHIVEIRLATDLYAFLLQTGNLCADPGVARGDARRVNGTAMTWLARAVAARSTVVVPPVDPVTVLHASLRFYASAAFDQETCEMHGPGQLPALLSFLRDRFAAVAVQVDDGVSQGATTTFRGRALVEHDAERYAHQLRCGFRAATGRVAEVWFELQVLPTLSEVFA